MNVHECEASQAILAHGAPHVGFEPAESGYGSLTLTGSDWCHC